MELFGMHLVFLKYTASSSIAKLASDVRSGLFDMQWCGGYKIRQIKLVVRRVYQQSTAYKHTFSFFMPIFFLSRVTCSE